jgi:hypothetical protein
MANVAAMNACTQLGLQFLDGTVAFTRLRLTRRDGQLKLQRSYVFDYTAQSIDRLQGFIVLHGLNVESVGFAPDLRQRSTVQATSTPSHFIESVSLPSAAETPTHSDDDKVLDLEKWRRTRDSRH